MRNRSFARAGVFNASNEKARAEAAESALEATENPDKAQPLVFASDEANRIADHARIEEEERAIDAELDAELRRLSAPDKTEPRCPRCGAANKTAVLCMRCLAAPDSAQPCDGNDDCARCRWDRKVEAQNRTSERRIRRPATVEDLKKDLADRTFANRSEDDK